MFIVFVFFPPIFAITDIKHSDNYIIFITVIDIVHTAQVKMCGVFFVNGCSHNYVKLH